MINQLHTAVIALRRDFTIYTLNTAAETLLGISARGASNRSLNDIIPLPAFIISHIDDATRTGQTLIDRQIQIPRRDRETAIVDCIITPVAQESHDYCVLIELNDIDRQYRIASERSRLKQQEQSRILLRSLAHEVLNPLGGIRGAAQLLEQDPDIPATDEYTSIIIKEVDRLRNLLRQILGPDSHLSIEQHNIHEILNHVSKVLLTGDQTNLIWRRDYDPSIPDVRCDRDRMIQVFINIVNNAVRALESSPDACLTIQTRVDRNFTIRNVQHKLVCKILFIDNGPGIEDEIKETLFYPLVTGKRGGTGLGLSISQSIVIQQGGLIDVQSTAGNTVFTVIMPLTDLEPPT